MGQFNAHQVPRYANMARLVFGEDIDLATVSPEIQFAIILGNDRHETMALQGDRLATVRASNVAASPGNLGFLYLFNPANSGVIATVLGAFFRTTTAQNMRVTYAQNAIGAATFVPVFADSRLSQGYTGAAKPTVQLLSGTNGAVTGIDAWEYAMGANVTQQLTPWNPIVIHPNNGVILWDTVVNEAIGGGFYWRERAAVPEELTGSF